MNRRILQLVGVCAVLAIGFFVWYNSNLAPVNAKDEVNVIVEIPTGSSGEDISKILQEKGIIRSALAFRLYTKWHGDQNSLKAGTVLLKPSLSVAEITEVIVKGFSGEAVITIPEGTTVAGIDAILAKKGLIKAGDLIACAKTCDFSSFTFLPTNPALKNSPGGIVEGYLFPDTYFVVQDTLTPKAFLDRLLSTFQARVIEGMNDDIKNSGKSLQEVITMASLVEEETRTDDERPIVAGILWKRLNRGMRLDVDAAVRYFLNKPSAAITSADLQTDSPYNLRKVAGLPPGPIANPSIGSIHAAADAKQSDYFFYLHDKNGQIHYAVTNDEHNENRARYLY
jgi:UPF0755 protein